MSYALTLIVLACFAQTTQPSISPSAPILHSGVSDVPNVSTPVLSTPVLSTPVAMTPMMTTPVSTGGTAAPVAVVEHDAVAIELADKVLKASGGDMWPKAKRIRFTCRIEHADKPPIEAVHNWDIRGGTDIVTWGGKSIVVDVRTPPADTDADAKAAFGRWTDDSYWLLGPLKIKDPGVTIAHEPAREIGGTTYAVLRLNVAGITPAPGEQFNFYIDPRTHLVRHSDLFPTSDEKTTGTWDGYTDFAGLQLSTRHVLGDGKITYSDISVELD